VALIETLDVFTIVLFSSIDIKYFESQRARLSFKTPIIMIQFHPHHISSASSTTSSINPNANIEIRPCVVGRPWVFMSLHIHSHPVILLTTNKNANLNSRFVFRCCVGAACLRLGAPDQDQEQVA
jgi:hypothetical protein